MAAIRLSKSKLIAFRQCPKRLWLEVHRPELKDESGAERRLQAGHSVGDVARRLVPDGLLVAHEGDPGAALAETRKAVASGANRPLFEPAFRHGDLFVRADVLFDPKGAATLVEVKSSGSVKDHHFEDAAIQTHVLRGAGIDVARTHVAHVNTKWIYPGGGAYAGLLTEVDVSRAIAPVVKEVPTWLRDAQGVASGREPEVEMGAHCHDPFECPFADYCTAIAGPGPAFPVEILPGNGGKALARRLREAGYEDLAKVPATKVPEGLFRRIHQATRSGRVHLDRGARRAIGEWAFPRYWLDFETVAFAVPIWAGTRPYQQIPFQWSCHVERRSGEVEHFAFLDLSGRAPARQCAEKLVATLGKRGAIVAYHAQFERRVIRELAERFRGFAPALHAIHDRIVDLEPVVKAHYYHRDMMGSFSIKAVLPTIAPALDYANLGEVQDGDGAQGAYLEAIHPDTPRERRAALKRDLEAYCAQDTRAMIVIAERLVA
ncbi:MAG: DUF2779 domain-containing protein [Burkholderiales bacterium]|nr:DUF2779 domain-containing protein [Burkholderiales bacterium]